ncbi:MAG: DegT/DnrJ/EryC1/StrS family aminotransferase [bacterium]
MSIPLSRPDIGYMEKKIVMEVLDSGWLSLGPKLEEFEKKVANYIGTRYAIAVNSGTSGLHLLIKSMNIGKGDEVITTPFSFIASSNCILYEGAVPVFVDIDPNTLCIDVNKIEDAITEKTKAILPVDVFGQPANMTEIMNIARKYGLKVIEDSCEAIGAEHRSRKVGTYADGSVFAFYPNKQITTGEGGVIVTDNKEIAQCCRSLRNQGRSENGQWLEHIRLGYNYRLDEISCALGIVQLSRIEEILQKRSKIAEIYNSLLSKISDIKILSIDENTTKMSWFVYVIQLSKRINRNKVMRYLIDKGVNCKPYFTPIHLQPFYVNKLGYKQGDFPVTEKVADSTLALPFFNNLKYKDIYRVVKELKEVVGGRRP